MKGQHTEISWFIRGIVEAESELPSATLEKMARELGVNLCGQSYFCVLVQMENDDASQMLLPIQLYDACAVLCDSFKKNIYYFLDAQFHVILVIPGKNRDRAAIVEKIYRSLYKKHKFRVRLGVGRSCDQYEKLVYSKVEAYESLRGDVAVEPISYIDDIYVSRDITIRKMDSEKKKILNQFQSGKLDVMLQSVKNLAEEIRKESSVRKNRPYPTSIRRTILELLLEISHICADMGVEVEKLIDYKKAYNGILTVDGTPEIIDLFFGMVQTLYDHTQKVHHRAENNMMTAARNFIDENLSDPALGLPMVGEKLGITPAYLSTFFMQETGTGFNDYVTEKRLQKARELLLTTPKKIQEIALSCGFQSANYFIVVFKKQLGVTPGEFRNHKI